MEKNLNPLYVMLEAKNALSKAAGEKLAFLISQARKGSNRGKKIVSNISNVTKKIDPLSHLSNMEKNIRNSKTITDKVAAGVGGGLSTAISGTAKGAGKMGELYFRGGRATGDAINSAVGAKYLTQGQNAVGKARKTLGGKAKQYGQNYKTVYDKIHT